MTVFPEIHLWRNTMKSLESEHGSESLSPHMCFNRGESQDAEFDREIHLILSEVKMGP